MHSAQAAAVIIATQMIVSMPDGTTCLPTALVEPVILQLSHAMCWRDFGSVSMSRRRESPPSITKMFSHSWASVARKGQSKRTATKTARSTLGTAMHTAAGCWPAISLVNHVHTCGIYLDGLKTLATPRVFQYLLAAAIPGFL